MTSARSLVKLVAFVAVACALGAERGIAAQDGPTHALTQQLTTILDQKKLDAVAARDPGTPDSFVAALYFPGAQLLVVRAKYSAPSLLNEKIMAGNYRDVYIDLNAASDPATKILIEDLQADGLRARRDDDHPYDSYTKGGGARFSFDEEWRKRKVSEDEYFRTFSEAEAQYAKMLEVLMTELKKAPAPTP